MPKPIPQLWAFLMPSKAGGALVGNRAGLQHLKEKIEAALLTGSARCEGLSPGWTEIRCEEKYPWPTERPKQSMRHVLALIVVATVVGALMLIFGLGIDAIIKWWR